MFALKMNTDKVLGLPGIGSKAIQNIEESLAALTFPEPVVVEPVKVEEPVAAEIAAPAVGEPVTAEEMSLEKKQAEGKKDAKKVVEEEENAKDGVSLDELFKMKPEIFQTTGVVEDDADKKKVAGKKGKKKGVELEFDEGLGAVVGRKKHKRGGDDTGSDWE